jgi:hypothetical protein
MSFIRVFHPVGQGAFYTEQHHEGSETLTVVYDCGSLTAPKDRFLRKVATALPPKSIIDLLFISHFHADHINGLDELKRKYRIRTVVLPELTEDARVLVKLENYLKYAGFSSVLIDDPQAYFGQKTLIIQIAPIGEDRQSVATANDDNGSFIDIPVEQQETPTIPSAAVISTNGRMQTVASGTPIRLTIKAMPFWEYVPFNYEFVARRTAFFAMLAKLKIEFNLLSSLEKVIAQKKDLSKAYRSLDGDLNENSLVVYSGALNQDVELYHKSQTCTCWHPFYYHSEKEGCLYLGDVDLTVPFIVGDLQKRLLSRWSKIQTVQIPHHGSVKNFRSLGVKSNIQAVISFGSDNGYGHPSVYVISSLHQLAANPILVTEQLETAFYSYST